jgi:uncharacterized protein with PIN domain
MSRLRRQIGDPDLSAGVVSMVAAQAGTRSGEPRQPKIGNGASYAVTQTRGIGLHWKGGDVARTDRKAACRT